jgi:hypothetical protein
MVHGRWKNAFESNRQKNLLLNISWVKCFRKISMESNTFARTSARRYRIVDAEERWWWIRFNIISSFCGLKCMDINKANKSKNIRQNIEFTLHHQKKSFQKENMFEPCDVICHVTVVFYIYHFIGALTLYVMHQ